MRVHRIIVAMALASSMPGANIFVTSFQQKVSGIGGCSLQEAIYSANFDLQQAIAGYDFSPNKDGSPRLFPFNVVDTPQCMQGSENDTIVLPTGAVFSFSKIVDDADNPAGPTATPTITSNITIEANGATLQWSGPGNARLFTVGSTGTLTIRHAYIKGFTTKGGNGADGGGGGMGAGGAIYVLPNGRLIVDSCTFDSNSAVGGNGSTLVALSGGGGGGLSGNGSGPIDLGGVFSSGEGGGGGGGSRGNGAPGDLVPQGPATFGDGGGGGGTVTDGNKQQPGHTGGGLGGGTGVCGTSANTGDPGGPGGGGGGGEASRPLTQCIGSGDGADGGYGGGGGGGGGSSGSGGNGGFGGGGGSSGPDSGIFGFGPNGGNSVFGGGGGASNGGFITGGPGHGGSFGGNADNHHGGGGAALGGAIFNDTGSVTIYNSTFANNVVVRGVGGGGLADNGADAGGAIFSKDGILEVINSTISGNQGTGSGAGIVVFGETLASFTLNNTIIYSNGSQECFVRGTVARVGVGNLIGGNGNGGDLFVPCPGAATGADPQLGPLQLNSPGITPTMAIPQSSPAFNAADPVTSLQKDQRGVDRPQSSGFDIGAFELCVSFLPIQPCVQVANAPPDQPATVSLIVQVAGAGVASPAAGPYAEPIDSVVILSATPLSGNSFVQWLGNVTDPFSASTTVVMTAPQTVTATFVAGSTVLGGNILTKSGPMNARVWPVNVANATSSAVTAHSTQINTFSLTQVAGAACTPVLQTVLPASAGDLAPGSSGIVNLAFDFTGCAAAARFTAQATFSANGGGVTGSMTRTNQFQ
ncbi:MAG TPA: choice-of-anchor Q domain-containing protein [Bryobacteraceae bacterium]|nr:choice-of-anchor Q domain-containing protein [Bryobacteraceae bacterium]